MDPTGYTKVKTSTWSLKYLRTPLEHLITIGYFKEQS